MYVKVGSTTIITEQNQSQLYRYSLSSPLAFQPGDVLGFHQPDERLAQLGLLYERTSYGPQALHSEQCSPQTSVEVEEEEAPQSTDYHVLIRAHIKGAVIRDQRQQITPAINFTCEGFVTRWVVGATWSSSDDRYPEIQLWRKAEGNQSIYHKLHGTFLTVGGENESGIYEYGDFSPIPFRPGDIVGMYLPRMQLSRLRVKAEDVSSHTNYYLGLDDDARVSPVEEMDLENSVDLQSQKYLPLVSAYITYTSTHSQPLPTQG